MSFYNGFFVCFQIFVDPCHLYTYVFLLLKIKESWVLSPESWVLSPRKRILWLWNAFYGPEINGKPIIYIGDLTFEILAQAVRHVIGTRGKSRLNKS